MRICSLLTVTKSFLGRGMMQNWFLSVFILEQWKGEEMQWQ